MAKLPDLSVKKDETIAKLVYESYEKNSRNGSSERIGASEAGKECDRAIWYSFHWADKKAFEGRMLRLFETGQLEEARVTKDLRAIGVTVLEVDPLTGKQFKYVDGHMIGKIDGKCIGVPSSPKTEHILEIKTHSVKSFTKLVSDGVARAKPDHHVQVQLYMHWFNLERALYWATCKNTDEIYTERIDYDKAFAETLVSRLKRIAKLQEPPQKYHKDPAFFVCKMCDYHSVCHKETIPAVNCRTCLHATPEAEGVWSCAKWGHILDYKDQQAACDKHLFIPALVPNSIPIDGGDNWIDYDSNGEVWRQGDGGISSEEMRSHGT